MFDRSGRCNVGNALETVVLIELERRRCEVTYVRTPAGSEVDFLARDVGKAELISADASDPASAERETRALLDAGELLPKAQNACSPLTRHCQPRSAPPGITVQPAYEWLLLAAG